MGTECFVRPDLVWDRVSDQVSRAAALECSPQPALLGEYGGLRWTPDPLPPGEQWIDKTAGSRYGSILHFSPGASGASVTFALLTVELTSTHGIVRGQIVDYTPHILYWRVR